MKKYIISLIILTGCILPGCNKFLDTKPEDFVTPEFYYNTEADLERSLNGVYNRLIDTYGRMYARGLFSFLTISDEFFYKNVSTNNVRVMDFDAGQLDVGKLWEVAYQGIDRANLLLENVHRPAMDETKRNAIKGQALFLRAYFYFVLADNFGAVPLRLTATKSSLEPMQGRAPVAAVYASIVADMKAALPLVHDIRTYTSNERITATAVEAVLARVYLTMAGAPLYETARYADALTCTNNVIKSARHSLNTSYSAIFINHSKDINEPGECIWEIGMYGNQQGAAQLAGGVGIENGLECPDDNIGYSGGGVHPTARLFNLFAPDDLRRDWAIAPYRYAIAAGVTSRVSYTPAQVYDRTAGKWRREYETLVPKNRLYNGTNFPVIRYADVLLMKAEAENAVNGPDGEAYEAVNMVRRRAYGKLPGTPDATADLPAGLSKADFLLQIQDERARELCFEGLRKHDLIRWGLYLSKMQSLATEITATAPAAWKYAASAAKNVTARNLLFPIPTTETTINHLVEQNPGW
ncbi:RagB/SusD family nutrient uptake outer membrane protein [Chitinophaga nivalis]|uniref:RagB/SusD family nutrient uptake outer membrane protein n=1 Tax=Chitinophaga nivalis TaxID=2991709 RepID=A0ABT3IJQ7_9BACT|nr:RagB/SusD family nutrient uptake outer membrane protein [Chitinophaga nivalis]MCW3466108.1 RagB/SusD family nutrient uptake outer membrane protein [Chitinophaga nivalis]MCW3484201.1 RagB/SusD family nutrient uptake outer membrane protein [Chitinophaga nivalis]